MPDFRIIVSDIDILDIVESLEVRAAIYKNRDKDSNHLIALSAKIAEQFTAQKNKESK